MSGGRQPRTGGSERWRQALLGPDANIQQAIRCLDKAAMRIVIVVDENVRLLGTISDGDIRRGLLRGLTLESPIETIVHRTPLVVPPEIGREFVTRLMLANKINQIPIVDQDRQVVGLHLWDGVVASPERPNTMVVMAGGLGTRLRPHTEACPKPLLPVAGRPMLEHIIERARDQGFSRFVLAVHYLGHMIEKHFGDGSRFMVQIDYLREDMPLGTAGALALLADRLDAPFVVTNGDVLTDIHYGELLDFHVRHAATGTMAVRSHEWQHPFGVVQTKGINIIGFEEKPVMRSYINAGVYALAPEMLGLLERGQPCDMPALFERARAAGKVIVAYPMHEPWLDVGRHEDLKRARAATDPGNAMPARPSAEKDG